MRSSPLFRKALWLLLALLAAYLFFRFLGPVFLPFAIGLLFARAAEPGVRYLEEKGGVPRWAAAGIGVAGLYGLLVAGGFFLCRLLCRELMAFVEALPGLVRSLSGPAGRLEEKLLTFAGRFPDGVGKALQEGVADFFRSGAGLAAKAYTWLFTFASDLLMEVPDIALFLFTTILSGFMLSAKLPKLKLLWADKAPEKWQRWGQSALGRLKSTLGGWCKAQLRLMAVTLLVLTAGFLILGLDYALLLGTAIAILDALPVFGVGTILIPWSILSFAQGRTVLGIGLLAVYGAASLIRQALEPKMLGKQIGLDPLLTLLSLYGGYKLLGLLGMIVFPIGAILGVQFLKRIDN